jgi:hypothetical protein
MILTLQNGYPSPWPKDLLPSEADGYAEAAGGVRLTLHGVVHFEWKHTITVEFKDHESYEAAKAATGWKPWDAALILEAPFDCTEGYEHPAILADVPYEDAPRTAYCGFMLTED